MNYLKNLWRRFWLQFLDDLRKDNRWAESTHRTKNNSNTHGKHKK